MDVIISCDIIKNGESCFSGHEKVCNPWISDITGIVNIIQLAFYILLGLVGEEEVEIMVSMFPYSDAIRLNKRMDGSRFDVKWKK